MTRALSVDAHLDRCASSCRFQTPGPPSSKAACRRLPVMPRFRAPAAPLRLPIAPCGLLPSLCLCLGLSGCAGPSRLDLPERDGLAPTLAALKHDGAVLQTPLTLDAVAILVVQNNP